MKKFLTLLLGAAVAVTLVVPAFAGTAVKQAESGTVTRNVVDGPAINTVVDVYGGNSGLTYTTVGGIQFYYFTNGTMHYVEDITAAGWTLDHWVQGNGSHSMWNYGLFTKVVDKGVVYDDPTYETTISYQYVDGMLTAVTNVVETVVAHKVTETQQAWLMTDPLTLDIHGTGKITVANNDWLPHAPKFYGQFASKFDFNADGVPVTCEWLSKNPDALLVMPENGKVTSILQLFGNLGGYANGFDKLATLCDKNGDGVVTGEELNGLALWIDSNCDGACQPSELHSLSEYGITKIYTAQKNFTGSYETKDGQTHTMWAWWPSVK